MATVYFYGDAVAIEDEWSVTPANVGVGDTFWVEINGKRITVTATATTVANVTALLAAAINTNADLIQEFTEVIAVDNSTYVAITGREPGVPIGLTSGAAGGTATNIAANTTAATGPEFYDNVDNYSGDALPNNGDTFVHVRGNIRYALNQSSANLAAFIKEPGSGEIGLPEQNRLGYDEYRSTYLTFSYVTSLELNDSANMVKIDPGSGGACTALIRQTGRREDPAVPAVLLLGSHASNALHLRQGDVGVAFHQGETANWPIVTVGYLENQQSDVTAYLGAGISTITSFQMQGGIVSSYAPMTLLQMFEGEFTRFAGAIGTVNLNGGNYIDRSAAAISTLLRVSTGGSADFGRDLRSLTVEDCHLFAGAELLDPNSRIIWTNGIDFQQCKLSDVTLDIGDSRNLAITAAA